MQLSIIQANIDIYVLKSLSSVLFHFISSITGPSTGNQKTARDPFPAALSWLSAPRRDLIDLPPAISFGFPVIALEGAVVAVGGGGGGPVYLSYLRELS